MNIKYFVSFIINGRSAVLSGHKKNAYNLLNTYAKNVIGNFRDRTCLYPHNYNRSPCFYNMRTIGNKSCPYSISFLIYYTQQDEKYRTYTYLNFMKHQCILICDINSIYCNKYSDVSC